MITCAIIDDEPLAVKLLENYVQQTPFLKLRHTLSSAVEAAEVLPRCCSRSPWTWCSLTYKCPS